MANALILRGYRISKVFVFTAAVFIFAGGLFMPAGAQEKTGANKLAELQQAPGYKAPAEAAPLKNKFNGAVTQTRDTPAGGNNNSVNILQFNNETVYYPASWELSGRGEGDLTSSVVHYRWKNPGRTCAKDTFAWARVRIGKGVAPCAVLNKEYMAAVGPVQVAGVTGHLYKRIKLVRTGRVPDQDSCLGQSDTTLMFEKNKFCYTLDFLTADKWLANFSSAFNGIIDGFTVKEKNKK